ncbi:PDF receptor-like, partial [Elysia marginata]
LINNKTVGSPPRCALSCLQLSGLDCGRKMVRLDIPDADLTNNARIAAKAKTISLCPYCPAQWDTVLCWPATRANATVELPCPKLHGLLTTRNANRTCGPQGWWQTKEPGVYTDQMGYSEYRMCYSEEAMKYWNKYFANKSESEQLFMKQILAIARTIETVGLCISLASTVISLGIFCYFRSLKCHRTLMHKHLFVALSVQVAITLVLYIDQQVGREVGGKVAGTSSGNSNSLFDTPRLCEALYSIVEYTRTVKFMWMFLEGFYLHNMIAVSVFSGKPNYIIYFLIGWGVPIWITILWVIPMELLSDSKTRCWFGYYANPLVWIIQGPRTAIMVINLFFLLNIIRVLVIKLRESQTNESNKLRKAVKAAIVLLPLLGLTNFVKWLEPDPQSNIKLSIYFLSERILLGLEGFFISLIYCFLNGEVRQAVRRQWERYRQHRIIRSSSVRRMSRSLSIFTSFTEVPHNASQIKRQSSGISNGDLKAMNGSSRSRFGSIFKGRQSRRQRERDAQASRRMELPALPQIAESGGPGAVNCRTDLMSEEKV